nr:EOG090X0G74 [Artemia franciscana]
MNKIILSLNCVVLLIVTWHIGDGDHDSGVDESTQEKVGEYSGFTDLRRDFTDRPKFFIRLNKEHENTEMICTVISILEGLTRELSPKPIEEKPLVINKPSEIPVSPTKSATKIPSVPASPTKSSSSQIKSEPCSINNDDTPKKKLPMNKVQVGTAPSPNIKVVTSKIGSLNNTSYKPSGGNVKIESRKIVIEAKPRIGARNENYKPSGGDKKIVSQKLKWEAKSKIGSLDNTKHKPGGGKIKIETVKLDFSEKAKSKVGSTVNLKHVPGGGAVKP